MANFNIIGKVGNIKKQTNFYLVDIAENKYDMSGQKMDTIWFKCICAFTPNANTGDTVIAEGHFIKSKNNKFPFAFEIDHLGVISSSERNKKEETVGELI